MANPQPISGRQLRHGSPEESLLPGESLAIKKRGGKTFAITRTDSGAKNINERLARVFQEIPAAGPRVKTNLARVILEDRE